MLFTLRHLKWPIYSIWTTRRSSTRGFLESFEFGFRISPTKSVASVSSGMKRFNTCTKVQQSELERRLEDTLTCASRKIGLSYLWPDTPQSTVSVYHRSSVFPLNFELNKNNSSPSIIGRTTWALCNAIQAEHHCRTGLPGDVDKNSDQSRALLCLPKCPALYL